MKKFLYILPVMVLSFFCSIGSAQALVDSTVEINNSTIRGPVLSNGDFYGSSIANIGDLDGDGVEDIVVGAYQDDDGGSNRGAVYIHFLNLDGSVKSTARISNSTTNGPTLNDSDNYGTSIANIGDLDGDGVDDIAVGAVRDDNGGSNRGAVHIHFLNSDGSIKSTVEINSSTTNGPTLSNSDYYGSSIVNIGDLDGDGVEDIAVGADRDDEGGTNRGVVHIHFLNSDGSIKSTVEINNSTANGPTLSDSDFYGSSITNIGDLNNDGIQDIAVGTRGDDGGGTDRGTVYIHFLNLNGSIKSTVEINNSVTNGPNLSDYDQYGTSIANIGDLDGDGVVDVAVGARGDDVSRGTVHIHYLNTDGSIKSTVEINDSTVNGPVLDNGDYYGSSIANLGDLDSDGVEDIVVGARNDDEGGANANANRGAVHIHFMSDIVSPTITEKTVIITPTADTTPAYTFNTTEAGTITYGGSCSSATTNAIVGDNTIVLNELTTGTYSDCTVKVKDSAGNDSNVLNISEFVVDVTPPTLKEITPIKTPTSDRTPEYIFSSDEAGTITYSGGCVGLLAMAKSGLNDPYFDALPDGTFPNCKITVTDSLGNVSEPLNVSEFTIFSEKTPIFRLYNRRTGAQLYTRGEADRDKIRKKFSDFEFTDGAPAFYASLTEQPGLTPIYRLYSRKTGAQLYTRGEVDRDKILKKWPDDFTFTDGVPAFYASLTDDGSTPIYRLYNKKTGMQLYTRGDADKDKILKKWPDDFTFTDGAPAFYASLTN